MINWRDHEQSTHLTNTIISQMYLFTVVAISLSHNVFWYMWCACYWSLVRYCPTTLPTLLHISTDTTYTVGRSIRDLRRRVYSSVIFVARSWCSFNVCFYYYHYLVAFTTLLLLSYCSTGALGITPNLRSYRTPVWAGHGKTLFYLVTHTHIIYESIMKHNTMLSTCIVLSVFHPMHTCTHKTWNAHKHDLYM